MWSHHYIRRQARRSIAASSIAILALFPVWCLLSQPSLSGAFSIESSEIHAAGDLSPQDSEHTGVLEEAVGSPEFEENCEPEQPLPACNAPSLVSPQLPLITYLVSRGYQFDRSLILVSTNSARAPPAA